MGYSPAKRILHKNVVPNLKLPETCTVNFKKETSPGINSLCSNSFPSLQKHLDILGNEIHGSSLLKEYNVIENACKKLQLVFPNMHKDIIKTFVKTRTFIQLRHNNHIHSSEIKKSGMLLENQKCGINFIAY